jgi:hypothetical protein
MRSVMPGYGFTSNPGTTYTWVRWSSPRVGVTVRSSTNGMNQRHAG